jgi:hypothetical protein
MPNFLYINRAKRNKLAIIFAVSTKKEQWREETPTMAWWKICQRNALKIACHTSRWLDNIIAYKSRQIVSLISLPLDSFHMVKLY